MRLFCVIMLVGALISWIYIVASGWNAEDSWIATAFMFIAHQGFEIQTLKKRLNEK
jgi:hypothetical protein